MASDDLLLERLLRVIDEGRRTATYKLALLTALVDAVAANPGVDHIPTRVIAEHVVELFSPQVREYVAIDGATRELRQISMKSSPGTHSSGTRSRCCRSWAPRWCRSCTSRTGRRGPAPARYGRGEAMSCA